jgi:hypothetical protein
MGTTPPPSGPVTIYQQPWVDGCGNIRLNGRTAATLLIAFQDASGNAIDVSGSLYTFEVDGAFKTSLLPVPDHDDQQLLQLEQDEVALVGVSGNPNFGPFFVMRDETSGDDEGVVVWEGMFIVRAFTVEPTTVVAPEPITSEPFLG